MEIRVAKNIISDCDLVKENIRATVDCNTRLINNELHKKIKNLEFLINELMTRKENLTHDVTAITSIKNRVEQTVKSFEYPKETCIKCYEIRKIVPDLCSDEVQRDLLAEVELIENSQIFFNSMLGDLREQLRKHKSSIYILEEDILRKKKALRIEKQNESLKICDSEISLNRNNVDESIAQTSKNVSYFDWLQATIKNLETAKTEFEKGRKLNLLTEESLSSKTAKLIDLHDRCNEKFCKRITQHKEAKNSLENLLSKVNEQIPQIKLTIKEIENEIVENEVRIRLAQTRLNNRIESHITELTSDEVESTLIQELKQLNQLKAHLQKRNLIAHSSLSSLNSSKNQYKEDIQKNINAIKVDEVECLPLRSSIHYHAY